MSGQYGVVVVGAGLSGILTAAQLLKESPSLKIAVLEKEERVGGRLSQSQNGDYAWYYGMDRISQDLWEKLKETTDHWIETDISEKYSLNKRTSFGVLSASKIKSHTLDDFWSEKGAKIVGGSAAARDWSLVDELWKTFEDGKKLGKNIGDSWKGTRKSASAIVMSQWAPVWGVGDLWQMSLSDFVEKKDSFTKCLYSGEMSLIIHDLVEALKDKAGVEFFTSCRVMSATKDKDNWLVKGTTHSFTSKKIVVAQNPWEAMQWLSKDFWPSRLAQVAAKAKPISAVVLCGKLSKELDLDDLTLVPSESAQVWKTDSGALCFQVTLPFELTLSAPAVVKAIKRLKRARKKLFAAFELESAFEKEHISLIPVAWAQPQTAAERRVMSKIKDVDIVQDDLAFCGDTYGAGSDGDSNIIQSTDLIVSKWH